MTKLFFIFKKIKPSCPIWEIFKLKVILWSSVYIHPLEKQTFTFRRIFGIQDYASSHYLRLQEHKEVYTITSPDQVQQDCGRPRLAADHQLSTRRSADSRNTQVVHYYKPSPHNVSKTILYNFTCQGRPNQKCVVAHHFCWSSLDNRLDINPKVSLPCSLWQRKGKEIISWDIQQIVLVSICEGIRIINSLSKLRQ